MIRKIISVLLSVCMIAALLCTTLTAGAAYEPDFEVSSQSVLLLDMDSEKVLYAKNPDKICYPASLVKIMTFLIVMEHVPEEKFEETATAKTYIFDRLYGMNASNAGIKHNEEVRIIDLLYAMMLASACEAASILADYVGEGSTENFVAMMNEKAKALGCNNTVFKNEHGLHDPEQVTTANDMQKIIDYAIDTYPLFLKISKEGTYVMPPTNKHSTERTIRHTNLMMFKTLVDPKYYYAYIKGIKTGTTSEAGKNMVSMATKDNYSYLLITLHAPTKYENGDKIADNLCFLDHKNIYNWAFSNFSLKSVVEEGQTAGQVKVKLGKDKDVLLLEPENKVLTLLPKHVDISAVQKVREIPESVNAPIQKGQVIGKLKLKLDDEVIGEVNLVATEAVERSNLLYILDQIGRFFSSIWFRLAMIVIVIFLVIYITLIVMYNRKKKKRKRVRTHRHL